MSATVPITCAHALDRIVVYAADRWTIESKRSEAPVSGRTPTGYGSRLPTDRMVRLDGIGPWRRVYVVCFSNVGSAYITVGGARFWLRDFDLAD